MTDYKLGNVEFSLDKMMARELHKWEPCGTLQNGLDVSWNATKAQSNQKKSI